MSKSYPKSNGDIMKKHHRKYFDLRFKHTQIAIGILLLSTISLFVSVLLDSKDCPFWSSIFSNIFAGLITGLILCIVSGIKQNEYAKLEGQKIFLNELDHRLKDFFHYYNKLCKKQFSVYTDDEELFDFIYSEVGSRAQCINSYILQGSFDEGLSIEPVEYCRKMGYDALDLTKEYQELHGNLYNIDVKYPRKKEILGYFRTVVDALRRLSSATNRKVTEIDRTIERMKHSIF